MADNFSVSVGTVDRVLAAQIRRVFDDTIINDMRPQDIGAAPIGAGSIALILPQYKPSNPVGVFCPGADGSTTGPVAGDRRFSLIYLPAIGSLNKFAFKTASTAPSSSHNVQLALWAVGADGKPADFLGEALTTTGTLANTVIETALASNIDVGPGFYYMSFTSATSMVSGNITSLNATVDGIYGSIFGKSEPAARPNILRYTTATSYDQKTHETFVEAHVNLVNMTVEYA
jgi:hypothetical protein